VQHCLLAFIQDQNLGISERDEDFRRLFGEAEYRYQRAFPPQHHYEPHPPSALPLDSDSPSPAVLPLMRSTLEDVITIGALLNKWLDERKPPERTRSDWTMAVRRFHEVTGRDVPVHEITRSDARNFKEALLKLPRNMTAKLRALTVPQII